MPVAFLVLAAVGLAHTLVGLRPPRRPVVVAVSVFFPSWLTSDLAAFHLLWQVATTALWVRLGALDAGAGRVGLGLCLISWTGLVALQRRHRRAATVLDAALREGLGTGWGDLAPDLADGRALGPRALLSPFVPNRRGVRRTKNVRYGPHRRQRLDVHAPEGTGGGRPVLLQLHGGAWVFGQKHTQAQPLLHHLARNGWVCVAPNYRVSPGATFPDHLVDAKRALAWIREHAHEHGGDPSFVVVTGGSAGGHLASLVALTPNDARFQPGFEAIDTAVAGCVPFYGVYDFLDRHGVLAPRDARVFEGFLARVVMKSRPADAVEAWEAACPIACVGPGAPPFFVLHGGQDTLAPVEGARHFVAALRAVSAEPVVYAELPGTQHAFDVLTTVRSQAVVGAVARFLGWLRATHPPVAASRLP